SAPSPAPSASVSPGPSVTAASPPATPAGQVLTVINAARSTADLPALTISVALDRTGSAHNALMAGGCGLFHQCPGEPDLGARETAAGISWTAAGENIGEGGPVAVTAAAIAQMAVSLTQDMLNEQPPNDGHRKNILSTAFAHIGIAVYRDSSGAIWLTQDFSS
ncbi:MAG: CAP domain-containing protein, partial [Actinomycetota bacterium]|nr:CAP domain-containing protein [Actinomycetota bacterium]